MAEHEHTGDRVHEVDVGPLTANGREHPLVAALERRCPAERAALIRSLRADPADPTTVRRCTRALLEACARWARECDSAAVAALSRELGESLSTVGDWLTMFEEQVDARSGRTPLGHEPTPGQQGALTRVGRSSPLLALLEDRCRAEQDTLRLASAKAERAAEEVAVRKADGNDRTTRGRAAKRAFEAASVSVHHARRALVDAMKRVASAPDDAVVESFAADLAASHEAVRGALAEFAGTAEAVRTADVSPDLPPVSLLGDEAVRRGFDTQRLAHALHLYQVGLTAGERKVRMLVSARARPGTDRARAKRTAAAEEDEGVALDKLKHVLSTSPERARVWLSESTDVRRGELASMWLDEMRLRDSKGRLPAWGETRMRQFVKVHRGELDNSARSHCG